MASNGLNGMKVAILVEKMYEDRELWYPADRLKEAGAEVVLVGPRAGETYPSKHGYPAKSDRAASEVSADEFQALVIPGGYAPDHMRRDEAMVGLVREMVESGKPVAAICHAGWMLCSAKVLDGRRATSYASIRDDMEHAGADWVDEEVVRDGNLITSRDPGDLPAFLKAIIEALTEATVKA
ncbi:MAG: type 1 glutamine amidotransferase domain-containing protein [Planctomycetales bacterium]